MSDTFQLDGAAVPFAPGQTVIQAALAAGHYIKPFALSLSKGHSWFDKLTTNGLYGGGSI